MPSKKPRILTLDIETCPLESWTWGTWDQNIGLDMIKTEWSILSYAAKWLGKKKLIYADTGGRGVGKVRDDHYLLEEIHALLDEADIVIAQNGIKFDVKKINARLIMNGFPPYSPIRVIDTLRVAKKHFAFTSNKLEWMSLYLTDTPKSKHKKFPGFELWKECVEHDNPAAWAEMKQYNKRDVVATEKVYLKQRPWIANHPNLSAYHEDGPTCPNCDSADVIKKGYATTQAGKYQQYKCNNCGAWPRGKQLLSPLNSRKGKLV